MSNIATRNIVLKLNSAWQKIGYGTVAEAISDLVAGESIKALDIQYEVGVDGRPITTQTPYMLPLSWEQWLELPIRPWDFAIHSSNLTVRVPTVVVTKNYSKMPMKTWDGKPTLKDIFMRDKGICQYTGKSIQKRDSTMDHVIPKSKGGSNDWPNIVLTSFNLNSKKGNKLNSEAGLKLLKKPTAPRPVPISQLITEIRHLDHTWFIKA